MRALMRLALALNNVAVSAAPWRVLSSAATVAGARYAVVSASVFGRRNVIVADPSGRRSICCHVNAAASLTRARVSRIVRMRAISRSARFFATAGDSIPRPRGRGRHAVASMRATAAAVIPADCRTVPPASRWSRTARLTAARTSAAAVGFVGAPASLWAALDGGEGRAEGRWPGAGVGEVLDEGGECFRIGRKRGGVDCAGEGFPFAPTVPVALSRRGGEGGGQALDAGRRTRAGEGEVVHGGGLRWPGVLVEPGGWSGWRAGSACPNLRATS